MYVQVLSSNFLEAYGKDVINIHHGLLPSFKGGNPSKQVQSYLFNDLICLRHSISILQKPSIPCFQAFEAGVKLIGATAHFVTKELDEGPIIEQMVNIFI